MECLSLVPLLLGSLDHGGELPALVQRLGLITASDELATNEYPRNLKKTITELQDHWKNYKKTLEKLTWAAQKDHTYGYNGGPNEEPSLNPSESYFRDVFKGFNGEKI